MDNLRFAIEILFCKVNPEDVLHQFIKWDSSDLTEKISATDFVGLGEISDYGKNWEELNAILQITKTEWCNAPETYGIQQHAKYNIFYTLVTFTREILMEVAEKPMCEFSQLLRWRDLSYKLGEDLLITAYFANKDILSKRQRHYFSWAPTISTNNNILREMLSQGVTDLHFHLFGSSLNFDISWLSLMNNISDRKNDFSLLNTSRNPETHNKFRERNSSLFLLGVKACAIRQLLFRVLIKESATDIHYKEQHCFYKNILSSQTDNEISIYIEELQKENSRLKFLYGKKYDGEIIDYAIRHNLSDKNYDDDSFHNSILHGERWLMYKMFHIIFSQKDQRSYFKTYFYAYLLIKIKIRKEFIQLNNYPGFHNFQDYQNRKVLFIKDNSIYEKILISYSINNATKGQPVKYLEVRITPQESLDNNISFIKYLDKTVSCPHKNPPIFSNKTLEHPNFFYIFHFIKNESKDSIPFKILMTPRNNSLREKVKEQTMALNLLRRQYCNTKDRFIGVDAASSEIGYRPEIFAQAFRYLKKYSCELNNHFFESSSLNPLGFTYHVGEDFLDIADGLRAIDETIKFLNFRKGDRLGHCLALGVSPSQYYTLKKKCIILPKQDLLDNIVWLLMQIKIFNITCPASLILEFHQLYEELWDDIYPPFDDNINIPYEIYYLSWLLRGDNPNIYLDNNFRKTGIYTPITYWECCALNRYSEEIHQARKNQRARDIYFHYHFNRKVRGNGMQYYEYKIKDDYIQLIENIQNAFMFDISEKQLAIETNPTSNKLIGSYSLYADHPLKRFFNLGLTCDSDKIRMCPQISVSINSDDLGIFSTNIENEYALIAIAMEKMKNEDGSKKYNSRMIYDWLQRIQKMGFEQKFKKDF